MKESVKLINIGSLILKGIALLFFILALIFPWCTLQLDDFVKVGQVIVFIIYLTYIISFLSTFIGMGKGSVIDTIEEVGIFVGLITVAFYTFYLTFIMFLYTDTYTMFQLGYIFAFLSIILIFIDFHFTRDKFNQLIEESDGLFSKLNKKLLNSESFKKVIKTTGEFAVKKTGEVAGDFISEKAGELTGDEYMKEITKKNVKKGIIKAGKKGIERITEPRKESGKEVGKPKDVQKSVPKSSENLMEPRKQTGETEEKPEDGPKPTLAFSLEVINVYSIMIKSITIVFIILSLIIPWISVTLSDYIPLARALVVILFLIYSIGISFNLIGIVKHDLTSIVEEASLITALISLAFYFLLSIIIIIIYHSKNITFELGYYLALFSLLLVSMDRYALRSYYENKPEGPRKVKRQKEERMLDFSDRTKTNADFPERWALIHGEKPTEKETFLSFKELEINSSLSKLHPNYIHLKMKNILEQLGYRIKSNQVPLEMNDDTYIFYDLYGKLKASIKTQVENVLDFVTLDGLISVIFFIIISILLVLLNLFRGIHSYLLLIFCLFILIPLSILFLMLLIPEFRGYTHIYVLEQGNAWYGRDCTDDAGGSKSRYFESPVLGFNQIISLGLAVKHMNIGKAKQDLDMLYKKLKEF